MITYAQFLKRFAKICVRLVANGNIVVLEWYSSGEETPLLRAQAGNSARRFKSSPLRHRKMFRPSRAVEESSYGVTCTAIYVSRRF